MTTISVSSLPVTSPEPAWIGVPCRGCQQGIIVPSDSLPALCSDCQRSAAMNEAKRLCDDAQALIMGTGVFACLRIDERAEQLEALGIDHSYMVELSDAQLIELVGRTSDENIMQSAAEEIGARIDAGKAPALFAPQTIERQRIELDDEQQHREATIERELAEAGVDEGHDGIFA